MDCPICTGGNNITTEELKEHLTAQHQMDETVATFIDYLFKRLEKLDERLETLEAKS